MGSKLYAKGEGFNPTTSIDDVEGLREELDALKPGSGGGGGDNSDIERRLTTAEGEIDDLQRDVAEQSKEVAAVGAKVNTLQGTDSGKSVRTIAAEETAKIVGNAPANYDTLKEIADYIATDATGAAELSNKVNKNANDIAKLAKDLDETHLLASNAESTISEVVELTIPAIEGELENKLGKTEKVADSAKADYATSAGSATNATNATNASQLGGVAASGYALLSGAKFTGLLNASTVFRVNASAEVYQNCIAIRAETVGPSNNQGLAHIGTNYGNSYPGNYGGLQNIVDAIAIYRSVVGIGRTFTFEELLSVYTRGERMYINGTTNSHIYTSGDASATGANPTSFFRWGRFDENGGLKMQFGADSGAKWELINKVWNKTLFSVDTSGNLSLAGTMTVGDEFHISHPITGQQVFLHPTFSVFGYNNAVLGHPTYVDGYKVIIRSGANYNQTAVFNESGNVVLSGTLTATATYHSSDERLKTFEGDLEVDLEKIKALPKKYFHWTADADGKRQLGTSAQAVEEVFPELVSTDADGYKSVNYANLSIVALAAVDKLTEQNKALEERLARIEALLNIE